MENWIVILRDDPSKTYKPAETIFSHFSKFRIRKFRLITRWLISEFIPKKTEKPSFIIFLRLFRIKIELEKYLFELSGGMKFSGNAKNDFFHFQNFHFRSLFRIVCGIYRKFYTTVGGPPKFFAAWIMGVRPRILASKCR